MRLSLAALAAAALTAAPPAAAIPQPAAPRATVVMIPGSGFNGAQRANARRMSFTEGVWRSWGFRTRIAAYRRGKAGLIDVTRAVDRAKRAAPRLPLCVYGESSGGAWALLSAAQRPTTVACAVVLAGITDQETLARSPSRPARHLALGVWPRYFGRSPGDDRFEPYDVWAADPPDVPVLLAYSRNDRIVPPQQGELLATRSPAAELRVLRPGRHRFVHARVDPADFVRARRAARALVDRVSRPAAR